jgi:hypothetical protein
LTKAKYKYFGLLLACILLGFAVATPASATAPSWVSDGQFANYNGGFNFSLGTQGLPGYVKFQLTLSANWALSNTAAGQTTVTGGWNTTICVFFNGTQMINESPFGKGTEVVNTVSGNVLTIGGFDFFGMETPGQHTVLWVDNTTGLTPSNITIGGRHSATITAPLYLSIFNATLPATRFYDTQTGLLLGFDITLNLTGGSGGFLAPTLHGAKAISGLFGTNGAVGVDQGSSLSGLTSFVISVVISSTNIVVYAWNPGGVLSQWLLAGGLIVGLSLLFGVLIYVRKK